MVALAADMALVTEDNFAASGGPATSAADPVGGRLSQGGRTGVGDSQESGLLVQSHGDKSGTGSQDRMVPEDTDGLGSLLGLQQSELHSDWLVQSPWQELLTIVDTDAYHGCVDDWALGDSDDRKVHSHQSSHQTPLSPGDVSHSLANANLPGPVLAAYLRLRLSGS